MERVPWFFVLALLAVDLFVLHQRHELQAQLESFEQSSAVATTKVSYAHEEEDLLGRVRQVPPGFPRLADVSGSADAVEFVLLASADDCTNAIEDEVTKLNQIAAHSAKTVTGIRGFFVDVSRPRRARAVLDHLSPPPLFPFTIQNPLGLLRGATTPLVLVIRSKDGRILDASKPIPQDYPKLDAFYSRWSSILGLG